MPSPRSRTSARALLHAAVVALAGSSPWGCGSRTTLDGGGTPAALPSADPDDLPPDAGTGGRGVEPIEPLLPPPPPPPPPPCEAVSLPIDELRPSVTLLVDQSGSMRSGYPTGDSLQTRWSIVRQALLDETHGVVRGLEHAMEFSLAFYTSHNGFSSGTCPILSQVNAATGNYEAIRSLYDATSPDYDTPTGPAIAQVVRQIRAAARPGPEVLLLVTDGDPDTCEVPDPQTDGAQLEAIAAASVAHAVGIDFYVLGIATDISGDKLQQLANAGQGRRLEATWGRDADAAQPFQASGDVAGLNRQLREILARVPLCDIALHRDVTPEEMASARVVLDGKPLAFGGTDGYLLVDSRHLRITGQACQTLRATGKQLSVRISCD